MRPFPLCMLSAHFSAYLCTLQLCPNLCNPMDCRLPGSSVHGDSPGKNNWSGLPCPPPGDLSDPGIELASLTSPALAGRFFTTNATWEAQNISSEWQRLWMRPDGRKVTKKALKGNP